MFLLTLEKDLVALKKEEKITLLADFIYVLVCFSLINTDIPPTYVNNARNWNFI